MGRRKKTAGTKGFERRLYECLGVRLFKKAVLKIEKAKYKNKPGRNINYHLRDGSLSSMRSFTGYLAYNALLHVFSSIFAIAFFAVSLTAKTFLIYLNPVMLLLLILNLYCIMLQRYTYLNLKDCIALREKKMKDKAEAQAALFSKRLSGKSDLELNAEFDLITKIKKLTGEGKDCVLTIEDENALKGISEVTERSKYVYEKKKICIPEKAISVSINLPCSTYVTFPVEKNVSYLQTKIRQDLQYNILFGYCVICETGKCEKYYRKVFPFNSRDMFEIRLNALVEAYLEEQSLRRSKEDHGRLSAS